MIRLRLARTVRAAGPSPSDGAAIDEFGRAQPGWLEAVQGCDAAHGTHRERAEQHGGCERAADGGEAEDPADGAGSGMQWGLLFDGRSGPS